MRFRRHGVWYHESPPPLKRLKGSSGFNFYMWLMMIKPKRHIRTVGIRETREKIRRIIEYG